MVYGLQYLAARVFDLWRHVEPDIHPLQRLATQPGGGPGAVLLAITQAVVLAPVIEELVFRGVMLPWLSRRWWGGWFAMAGAVAIGVANAWPDKSGSVDWMPLTFVVAVSLAGICFTLYRSDDQPSRRAVVGTAILFAMFHVNVWPTPIPLLLLGLALGWSAFRSRSLIAPIALHALFNATSTLLMLGGVQDVPTKTPEPAPQVKPAADPTLPPGPGHETSALRPPFPAPGVRTANTRERSRPSAAT
jgi:membrane protease YdiL (CAAX protease family)